MRRCGPAGLGAAQRRTAFMKKESGKFDFTTALVARFPAQCMKRLSSLLIVCFLTGSGSTAFAGENPPRHSDRNPDSAAAQRANELLKRMGDYLAQAQFFSV